MAAFNVLNADNWIIFLQVLARTAGMVFLFPLFSWRGVPAMLRAWIAVMLAMLLFLPLGQARPAVPQAGPAAVFSLVLEVLTGLAIGYLAVLFFSLFIKAGQMIDLKAGLMLSGVLEPQYGSQVTFMGQFFYLLAMVFYLAVNGHHLFIKAMADSFRIIPLGTGLFKPALAGGVLRLFADIFILAFQISAPVIVVLMVVDIALGLIAKTVPQVHVFIEGLPLKIALALLIFALLLPMMGGVMETVLERFITGIYDFMQGWF